jgi:Ca-activated chloride channel family protein
MPFPDRRPSPAKRTAITSAPALLLTVVLAGLAAGAQRPVTAQVPPGDQAQPATLDPSEVGSGELLWRSPRGFVPLPVLDLEVRLEVTGILVHGTVRQTFRNPLSETIECLYVFPLPERAAVHRLVLRIGERRIVSVVQEREEARRTYEQGRREGRKAALLEQERPNLFTVAAANINPDESVQVTLEYLQELSYADGEFGLAVPLTFTPRFSPAGVVDAGRLIAPRVPTTGRGVAQPSVPQPSVPLAEMSVRISAGFAVQAVRSLSHAIRTWWDDGALEVELQPGKVSADRDFLLAWRPAPSETVRSTLFAEDREDGRYLLMMLLPPLEEIGQPRPLPTETLFVVDVSGSMDGPSIAQAREALLAALGRIRADDTFDILTFNDDVHAFRPGFVAAAGPDLEAARDWVGALQAGGGTMIEPALRRALDMMGQGGGDRLQRIIFLTDGAVGNEEEVLRALRGQARHVRLHMLGIGSAPNQYLMHKMAEAGRGLCDFISTTDGMANQIDAFFARLERPVLADLRLEWEGAAPPELYPPVLPDLHAGEPLIVSARLAPGASPGRPMLVGRAPLGPLRQPLQVLPPSPAGSGVAVRWARARVETLLDSLQEGTDAGGIRGEVVQVSKSFGIATPFTSLVAVEEFPTATGEGCTLRVPVSLPAGYTASGALPQGGTQETLQLLLGLILTTVGGILLLCDRLITGRRLRGNS